MFGTVTIVIYAWCSDGYIIYLLCRLHSNEQDTVDDAASLDVPTLTEMKLDELSEATGVVVVNCFGISKRFHDWTVKSTKRK